MYKIFHCCNKHYFIIIIIIHLYTCIWPVGCAIVFATYYYYTIYNLSVVVLKYQIFFKLFVLVNLAANDTVCHFDVDKKLECVFISCPFCDKIYIYENSFLYHLNQVHFPVKVCVDRGNSKVNYFLFFFLTDKYGNFFTNITVIYIFFFFIG